MIATFVSPLVGPSLENMYYSIPKIIEENRIKLELGEERQDSIIAGCSL